MTGIRAARPARWRGFLLACTLIYGGFPEWAAAQAPSVDAPPKTVPLKAVVFLPGTAGLGKAAPGAPAMPIDASRVPMLGDPAAQALLRPYIGLPISPVLLDSLRAAVSKYYVTIHRPFVNVTIPNQDVTDGVVRVVVVEARLGKVTVGGAKWFDREQYLDAFHSSPGDPIDSTAMQADLDWINHNQYRHATVTAAAGSAPGTTDLDIQTQERRPFAIMGGGDNTGNQSTGLYRLSVGADWGNAFWRGDDLNYRFTMSPDGHQLREHELAYTLYAPWRDALTLSASLADFDADDGSSPISTTGRSESLSLRYAIPLPAHVLTQNLTFGFDFKSTNNDILFGGMSVFPTTTEVDQFVASYGGQWTDAIGSTTFSLALTYSPGGLTGLNTSAAFAAQQAGATADYVYGRATFDRLTPLPAGLAWDVSAVLQLTDAALLPSEQMGFGGPSSNRGFVTYGVTRDNGFQLTNELRAPPMSPGLPALLGLGGDSDQLVPFVFVDYGSGWSHLKGSIAAPQLSMASAGPGMIYQFSRYGSARLSYGLPLQHRGVQDDTLPWQFSVQFAD